MKGLAVLTEKRLTNIQLQHASSCELETLEPAVESLLESAAMILNQRRRILNQRRRISCVNPRLYARRAVRF